MREVPFLYSMDENAPGTPGIPLVSGGSSCGSPGPGNPAAPVKPSLAPPWGTPRTRPRPVLIDTEQTKRRRRRTPGEPSPITHR